LALRAELDLLLKDQAGNWHPQNFRVDTGSDLTSMPAWRAKQLGLALPQLGVTVPLNTVGGVVVLTVRSGYLRFQVAGMDATEYLAPCHFQGDPDTPPDPNLPPASAPRNLLALAGVVDKLRLTQDGTPDPPAALYGKLVVEKL
jgi:hypothetical protein